MTASNFPACLAVTLAYEGGKANNPADPGGKTNKGITQRTYDAWSVKHGLPKRDVYLIADTEVAEIYQSDYWNAAGCNALPDGLDLCHFDAAVNSGPGQAAKWLAKAGTGGTDARIRAYSTARLGFLRALRTWATFGKGWSARVAGVEAKALAMDVAGTPGILKPVLAHAAATSASAATKAAVVKNAATLTTGAAAAAVVASPHPAAAATLGVSSVLVAIVSGFLSWRSGLRASAITHTASNL